MAKSNIKNYVTVIMDGTNKEVVDKIIDMFDTMNEKKYGESISYSLDVTHPSMIVVETKTKKVLYDSMQRLVDKLYPGLCGFDVNTAV